MPGARPASSMFTIGAVGARLVGGRVVEVAGQRRALLAGLAVFVVTGIGHGRDHAGAVGRPAAAAR